MFVLQKQETEWKAPTDKNGGINLASNFLISTKQ